MDAAGTAPHGMTNKRLSAWVDEMALRCKPDWVARALALRRNFFPHTPPSTTLSTSNATSYQLYRTACSALRR